MSIASERCVRCVIQRQGDVNSLFWLRLHSGMLGNVEIGRALMAVCEECRVTCSERNNEFFKEVRESLETKGILNVAPVKKELFVVARGKKAAWDQFEKMAMREELAGKCLQPFAFQTANERNFTGSLFFIFAHWQDGLHMIHRIVCEGLYMHSGERVPVTQIYEHRHQLAHLPVDCEVMESWYEGRMGRDQIDSVMCKLPEFLYTKLHALRYVTNEAAVTVLVKRKSRAKGDDFKVSYHFIFEIGAEPDVHAHVANEIFREYYGAIAEIQKDKSMKSLSDEQLASPAYMVDPIIGRPKQPVALLFRWALPLGGAEGQG